MTTVDTLTASKAVLDWGLCKAIRQTPNLRLSSRGMGVCYMPNNGVVQLNAFVPFKHDDAHMCERMVQQYRISTEQKDCVWTCKVLDVGSESHYIVATGESKETAVARCVVLLELGKTFECDDRLLGEQM